ncbi:NADH-quinone oxidoreductase subunit J [Natronospirillum operosum]|uniref:NADH-quinone oxidoreductase subunit J n=1 Tax=Natronospirillum operosum TaxID=2759953 RepID=A0A4Z0WGU4_9GAMM|nr:proton-conducting transporter membrane subunit [Natronospirillum operosum]TGG95768.1 NADH-quinone oxidoreductase subunit J [Natronospirillum operosum]
MTAALAALLIPLFTALGLLLLRSRSGPLVILTSLATLAAACWALVEVTTSGPQSLHLGDWPEPLAIRFQLQPITALLLVFTALIHLLVAVYAARSRHCRTRDTDYWPLSCLLQGSLNALWLSSDLFNWYVTLELLGLAAVALVALSGRKAYGPALNYLLLSLGASLVYLLGVALIYGRYGVLDITLLATQTEADQSTRVAFWLMTLGLMLKAALWPLHLWLPKAHASAPTAVSALLSALVVKGPLFILWRLWSEAAPVELAIETGPLLAIAGVAALLLGGWSALRTPWLKSLVAYSTVAQLGYALMALGLLMHWQLPALDAALWLFVLAHGLAKASMFLAAGELQATLGSKRVSALRGTTETMPVAMFAFAVAGGSLIGLPPSGGFLAKWMLLEPMLGQSEHWPWVAGILLGTLISAGYVFRVVALAFDRADPVPPDFKPDRFAHWLAMLPALVVWGLALVSQPLIAWLTGATP